MTNDVSPTYATGIDGGGTKTLAVIVDAQGSNRAPTLFRAFRAGMPVFI